MTFGDTFATSLPFLKCHVVFEQPLGTRLNFSASNFLTKKNRVWSQFHQCVYSQLWRLQILKAQKAAWVDCLYALLGSAGVKAEHKHVDEIDPRGPSMGGHVVLWCCFCLLYPYVITSRDFPRAKSNWNFTLLIRRLVLLPFAYICMYLQSSRGFCLLLHSLFQLFSCLYSNTQ